MITADSARRRYVLITFLTWLPAGLYTAPLVLLLLERGFSLGEVAAIGAVYGISVLVLELPTGGLSDVLGRRPVLVASAAAGLAGLALLGLTGAVWLLVVSAVLRGVARALSSGPAEAWYVDAVHAAEGRDADLGPGLARGGMAASAALGLGVLAGGVIPFLWPSGAADGSAAANPAETVAAGSAGLSAPGAVGSGALAGLAVPVLLAAAFELVLLLVVVFAMPEARGPRPGFGAVLRGVPATVATGLRLAGRDHVLVRVLLVAAATGTGLAVIELLTPAWMAVLSGGTGRGVLAYALVAAVGFAADGVGSTLGVPLTRWLGSPGRAACAGTVLAALGLAGLAGTAALTGWLGVVAAGAAYLLMFLGLGAAVAPTGRLLHDRVEAGERATVLSVQSLLLQLGAAAGSVALGALAAAYGPGPAFAVSALLLAAAALTVWGLPRRRDVQARALLLRHVGPRIPARDRPREDRISRS
ncbi:MFS transporter [Catellatospora vulcania]|uniref:MFS transporter n=1 Tax=Catellatospora vulcania TaxID=1460450 RepID=UPI0018AF7148|nr:MFS transporter [Catellatospora vulcania]